MLNGDRDIAAAERRTLHLEGERVEEMKDDLLEMQKDCAKRRQEYVELRELHEECMRDRGALCDIKEERCDIKAEIIAHKAELEELESKIAAAKPVWESYQTKLPKSRRSSIE